MKPGDQYGIYDVIRLIGKGNMGTVYLMKIRDTGEEVAVKIIPYSDSETARENIATEKAGATLQEDLKKVERRVQSEQKKLPKQADRLEGPADDSEL